MAKKNFGQGIDAILGGKPLKEVNQKEKDSQLDTSDNVLTSQEIPEETIKICMNVEKSLLNQFKAIAYWERVNQRQLIESMIKEYSSTKGKDYMEAAIANYNQHTSYR